MLVTSLVDPPGSLATPLPWGLRLAHPRIGVHGNAEVPSALGIPSLEFRQPAVELLGFPDQEFQLPADLAQAGGVVVLPSHGNLSKQKTEPS